MKEFEYTIKDEVGIHARPAGVLSKEASKYKSTITIHSGEKSADTKRLMALMGLGVKQGMTIKVTVQGDDEDVATEGIKEFLVKNNY